MERTGEKSDVAGSLGSEQEGRLRRALAAKPDLETLFELAQRLFDRGENDESSIYVRWALALAPDHPKAQWNMAVLLMASARPEAAEVHIRRLIELVGERPRSALQLADCLKRQGKLDESEIWYRKATELDPANAEAWIDWCLLAEQRGNIPQAWELLGQAARADRETPQIRLGAARLRRREGQLDEAIRLLSEIPKDAPRLPVLFERGECFREIGRYEDAWNDLSEAKRLCREVEGYRYDGAGAQAQTQKVKRVFVRDHVSSLPRARRRRDLPQPLFVTGFPRSGTTLIEQILTSHPQVRAGDELRFVEFVTRIASRWLGSSFSYPECLAELSIGDNLLMVERLRDYYLDCARQAGLLGSGASFFTDKMPLNEMHLGLIHLIFPESPILYVRRHPLDIVCSNFESLHAHGFNQAFSVETSAQHYVLVDDLLAHYRGHLDLRLLEVRYEDLVAEPESQTRRMLDFVGLEFDARCLRFHENPRIPRTGSYAQVNQKLYDRSVYRYRNYRRHLDDAVEIMRPTLERLGYPLD